MRYSFKCRWCGTQSTQYGSRDVMTVEGLVDTHEICSACRVAVSCQEDEYHEKSCPECGEWYDTRSKYDDRDPHVCEGE